ncbi:MAG TPA: hypothetical protein VKR58_14460 [Aquella sp.]|nr:hypothetical protein [Aquella sp.]
MDKLKLLLASLNSKGIAFPMVRDPKNGLGSITCTMVVVSFAICVVGVIGKVSKVLDGIDLTAAHSLLVISISAYLGRKMQTSGKDVVMAENKEEGKDS